MKLFGSLCVLSTIFAALAADYHADVVVYGGSSGGVTAAVAAANNGKSVLIVEPSGHLGGMTTSGLGQVDIFRPETLGGLTQEYFERAANCPEGRIYWVTPTFGENVFIEMATESGVNVMTKSRLAENTQAVMKDEKIISIQLENGDIVYGDVFIDASYEGDLLKAANISYRVGREGRDEYGESAAGVRPAIWLKNAEAYDEEGNILPDLIEDEVGTVGAADELTQAYNFRLCMTQDKSNFVAIEKPANYNRNDYRNLLNWINSEPQTEWTFNHIISYWGMLSGGTKADINNRGNFSTDYINRNHTWPEASYAERDQMYAEHKAYTEGLLYFIANDPAVPANLRADAASWGLAADEFTDNNNWPHLLYVREARRMVGEYVMTQNDAFLTNTKPDSIGIGSYMLDSHCVRKFVDNGKVYMEGFISVFDGKVQLRPYEIPYRSIVPKQDECSNLMTVICFSASHVIYGSLRMEPVFMTVGEAAGVAAAMAIDAKVPVQQIDIEELQKKLKANGNVLNYPGGNMFPLTTEIDGYVIDDVDAKLSGDWGRFEVGVPMTNGSFVQVFSDTPSTAEFNWEVPEDGSYIMSVILPRHSNGKEMPVFFRNNKEEHNLTVDLSKVGILEEELHHFQAKKGDNITVIFSNGGKSINAVADAVIFRKIK